MFVNEYGVGEVVGNDLKQENLWLMLGDCLERMKEIPSGSVDAVICDLPYGTVRCPWDSIIPFEPLWSEYKRVLKVGAPVILFATQPFTTKLISSSFENFRYCWVWDKKFAGNFVQAKRTPMKNCEDVCVFTFNGKTPAYYPQMTKRDTPIKKGGNKQSAAIPISVTEASKAFGLSGKTYEEKYPEMLIEFNTRIGRGLHPTQKPVALLEYLLKTYTEHGGLVMDNTMGSGTTGVACANLNRKFIGIEMDEGYFNIARERILKVGNNE